MGIISITASKQTLFHSQEIISCLFYLKLTNVLTYIAELPAINV